MYIAVYWTLKKGQGNHILTEGLKFERKAFVKCYWIKGSWFPIAQFIKEKDNSNYILLEVEVYSVPANRKGEKALEEIDRLEWNPTRYKRMEIKDENNEIVQIYNQSTNSIIDKKQLVNIQNNKYARKSLSTNSIKWK